MVYGSGYCFTPAAAVTRQLARLDCGAPVGWRELTTANATRLLSEADLMAATRTA